MAKYSVGDSVLSPESGKHGVIVMVAPPRRGGRQLYKVNWGSYNSDELEEDLVVDCDLSDPYQRCSKGIFDTYSEYSKKNTTFKIRNSNNSTISSLKASKTLFRPYQFKPLLKFLNSPNRRLLVADEVGLGKTIEAGHIMLELKARRELRNVLIVCPKSLQDKWKAELAEKFAMTFKIYETTKDLIQDMKDHNGMVRAIVNYEKIRIREKDGEAEKDKKSKAVNLTEYLLESNFKFSLVLCDEAHKMRNRETLTYKGADIIMNQTAAAVFLTATPIMISTENLYNLLHLLDNTRYFNYQIFDNRLQENRPFVEALTALNHRVAFQVIAANLWNATVNTKYLNSDNEVYHSEVKTVGDIFADDDTMKEIMQLLLGGENTPAIAARLQYLLSSMSVMNSNFSRTRKRDVTTDLSQAKRDPQPRKIVLTENERKEFENVIEEYEDDNSFCDEYMEEKMSMGKTLGLVQKKRQIASSVYAYLNNESDLDQGIDAYSDFEDAKINELLKIIDVVFASGNKKLVVFALFRKTLKYLQIRLEKAGHPSLIIHGEIENRAEILEQFRTNDNAHILLSSEVGSEGLDMQFCNSMVNYDLPWNPMVVEQRIGRIDRFGQKSPVVHIFNLIVADSIQEQIYMRLLDRIGIFRETIGDMEAILDATYDRRTTLTIQDVYNKLEKQFFTNKLSQFEIDEKLKDIERAIENEKENIRHLEPGLNNTLTNDSYFQDEINRIKNNNAYVTEVELCNYLQTALRQELSHCDLVKKEDKIYELQLQQDPRQLYNFIVKYQPAGEEMDYVFRRFQREIEGKESLMITFDQETAYDNRRLMYLNIYHPIIQACLNYFMQKEDARKTTFCYGLPSDDSLHSGNAYYMALYQLTTVRMVQGIEKKTETLLPLLYDINQKVLVDNQDLSDKIFSESQVAGVARNPKNEQLDEEILVDMRYAFLDKVKEVKRNRERELTRMAEGDRKRNEAQTREYYNTRIANLQATIDEAECQLEILNKNDKQWRIAESTIRLNTYNINQLKKEAEERLAVIGEVSRITVQPQILSLNLVNII